MYKNIWHSTGQLLLSNITDSIAPRGFGVEHFFRDGHAGGVSIVYNSNLKVGKLRLEATLLSFEVLGIKILSRTGVTNIIGIYRPGSRVAGSCFFTELGSLFSEINMLPGNAIYIGDFNCPGKSNCEIDERLSDIIDLYNLKCCEGPATRLSDGARGNRLDLILHNLEHGNVTNPCTIDVGFSDHCLVRADFRFAAFKAAVASFRCRNLKRINYEELEEELWNCSFITDPVDTVDGFIDQLHHDVTCVLDRMAPFHNTKVRTGKRRSVNLNHEATQAKTISPQMWKTLPKKQQRGWPSHLQEGLQGCKPSHHRSSTWRDSGEIDFGREWSERGLANI